MTYSVTHPLSTPTPPAHHPLSRTLCRLTAHRAAAQTVMTEVGVPDPVLLGRCMTMLDARGGPGQAGQAAAWHMASRPSAAGGARNTWRIPAGNLAHAGLVAWSTVAIVSLCCIHSLVFFNRVIK